MDDKTEITSHGQTGGITAHTVSITNATPLAAATVAPKVPKPWWKRWWGFAVGAATIAGAVFAGYPIFHSQPGTTEMSNGKINITSHNQSGGITAHTVNIGAQPRQFSPQDGAQLTANIPKTTKVSVTATLGDGEAFAFAQQVVTWMRANGWQSVDGVNQAVFSAPQLGWHGERHPDGSVNIIVGSRQ